MIYRFATKNTKKYTILKLKNRIFLREIAYCKIKSATIKYTPEQKYANKILVLT